MSMSTPVTAAAELIGLLAERGYEPDEDAPEFCRADLVTSGLGSVRVVIADEVEVHVFDRWTNLRWSARLGNAAPLAAIAGVMDAAERDAREGLCECCGSRPAATVWAGTGQLACWECVSVKREAGMG